VGFVTQLAKDLNGGQTFLWKFDPKGIFTSSSTVKSKVREALVNQLTYLNGDNGVDLVAQIKYFGIPTNTPTKVILIPSDVDNFIELNYSNIFK
jgi:hypothetical protein